MADWQPIETAPRDGTVMLMWGNRASWSGGYSIQYGEDLNRVYEGITHWMPLPAPPKTEE